MAAPPYLSSCPPEAGFRKKDLLLAWEETESKKFKIKEKRKKNMKGLNPDQYDRMMSMR